MSELTLVSSLSIREAERAYREFFTKEFRSERLGSHGMWLGSAQQIMRVESPVRPDQLANLAQGMTPDGKLKLTTEKAGQGRVALIRLDLIAPADVSTVWALAPNAARQKIEAAHAKASIAAVERFQAAPSLILSALFVARASWQQTPGLHSTAFVIGYEFGRDGSAKILPPDFGESKKQSFAWNYESELASRLRSDLGIRFAPGAKGPVIRGVLLDLTKTRDKDQSFISGSVKEPEEKRLSGGELFARWKQQARDLNWGERETKALLRESSDAGIWSRLTSKLTTATYTVVHDSRSGQKSSRPSQSTTESRKDSGKTKGSEQSHSY